MKLKNLSRNSKNSDEALLEYKERISFYNDGCKRGIFAPIAFAHINDEIKTLLAQSRNYVFMLDSSLDVFRKYCSDNSIDNFLILYSVDKAGQMLNKIDNIYGIYYELHSTSDTLQGMLVYNKKGTYTKGSLEDLLFNQEFDNYYKGSLLAGQGYDAKVDKETNIVYSRNNLFRLEQYFKYFFKEPKTVNIVYDDLLANNLEDLNYSDYFKYIISKQNSGKHFYAPIATNSKIYSLHITSVNSLELFNNSFAFITGKVNNLVLLNIFNPYYHREQRYPQQNYDNLKLTAIGRDIVFDLRYFKNLKVAENFVGILPCSVPKSYVFRGKVLSCEKVEEEKTDINGYFLEIEIIKSDSNFLVVPMFIAKHNIENNKEITIGDYISGVTMFSGYIH